MYAFSKKIRYGKQLVVIFFSFEIVSWHLRQTRYYVVYKPDIKLILIIFFTIYFAFSNRFLAFFY